MKLDELAAAYRRAAKTGDFEPERSIRAAYTAMLRPGDCAVDVGVYGGRHLLAMANCVRPGGRVYGFEPIPGLARLVTAEATMRGVGDIVSISDRAVANFIGTSTFNYVKSERGYSGLKQRKRNGVILDGETIEVQVTTLDKALPADADIRFIKLDIEGGELWALRGGARMIERCRPVVSIEIGRESYSAYGVTAADISEFFYGLGYRIADVLGNPFETPEEFLVSEDLDGVWDYVAIRREDSGQADILNALAVQAPS